MVQSYLRDTFLMHAAVEHRPGYSSRVLTLQEEGLGFAILEAEDLAVAADVEFALFKRNISRRSYGRLRKRTDLARVDLCGAEGVVVGTHLDGEIRDLAYWVRFYQFGA